MTELTHADANSLLRAMTRIRMVEETIAARYSQGKMRCPVHLSIGQEAIAAGVCGAMRRSDAVFSTHRCHAHYLAKGGDLKRMLAEIFGKAEGCVGGRGGSMHLADLSCGVMMSVPIVASSIPLAVGTALADARSGRDRVSAVFIGDASVEEGVFFESVNFALLRRLPVVFVCENNQYSVYTPLRQRQPARPIGALAAGLGVEVETVDGNDARAVRAAAHIALDRARSGRGPTFMALDTYRHLEHCGPNDDDHLGYRPDGELARWKQRDPVARMRSAAVESGAVTDQDIKRMEAEIGDEIAAAFVFADAAALPEPSQAARHVYAEAPNRG